MKNFLFVVVPTAVALLSIGCASASEDSDGSDGAAQAATNARWQKIVSCSGGAAQIEVDANERRRLRLVISDKGAAKHVSTGMVSTSYQSCESGPGLVPTNPCRRANGDLVIPGGTNAGVFHPDAFRWLRGTAQLFSNDRPWDYLAYADGGGLKVEFMSDKSVSMRCDGTGDGCQSDERAASKQVRADWYFRSCTSQ